jgi:hypothetical protein
MRSIFAGSIILFSGLSFAAEPPVTDASHLKEPKYVGKPNYCLLAFGRQAAHCVWLVQDGNTLYVDRDGDGDLTKPANKVMANQLRLGDDDGSFAFDAGDLTVGGKTHKDLRFLVSQLRSFAGNPNLMAMPKVAAAVKANPSCMTARLELDVDCASLKGGGSGGRVVYMVGPFDTEGPIQLAAKAADAPIIYFDGILQITFYGNEPVWRGGRDQDVVLCVGTAGRGPGTFAMIKYEGTVPANANPKIEVTYRPKDPAQAPTKELFELRERC